MRDEIAPAFATVLRQLIVLAVLLPFVRATLAFHDRSERDAVPAHLALGVAISFAGILVIATQGEVQRRSFNIGDLLVCLSMAMWAAYTVLLGIRCGGLSVLARLKPWWPPVV